MITKRQKRWMLAAAMTLVGAGTAWAEVQLPADYTQLAYIDASGTQYLKTGVNVQSDTSFEISFGRFRPYLGSSVFEQGAWANTCRLGADVNGRFEFGTATAQLPEIDPEADYVVTVGDGNLTIVKNGGAKTEFALDSITGSLGAELALFARNNGGDNRAACRFYGMKIWDGEKALLRDFIPCRKPSGEAGLWDTVSGEFFGNAASGSRFYTEYDEMTCVRSVKQVNQGYIDTGYYPNQNTCVEMDLTVGCTHETWFGAAATEGSWWATRAFGLANDNNKNIYVGFGNWSGTSTPILQTGWQGTIRLSKDGFQIRQAGQENWTTKLAVQQGEFTSDQTLYLCANNTHPDYIFKKNMGMSFTGVRVYEQGELIHEYLPACDADGTVGVCDIKFGNAFIPTTGITGCAQFFNLNDDLVYLKQEDELVVHKGTLLATDMTGVTAVEKVSSYTVDASAVTGYPALTLSEGVFSLANKAVTEYGVTGALTLKGGAHLAIDVTVGGCDRFAVGSLVLDETLTPENPFTIEVNAVGVPGLTEPLELVTGGNLAEEDVRKFRLVGISSVVLYVTNGNLMMKSSEGGVARAIWLGGADSALDNPENWTCLDGDGIVIPGAVPTEKTTVTLPDGCVFNCTNGAPFVCAGLIAPKSIGGDCDWSGVPCVTINEKLNICGHVLKLSGFDGTGKITGGGYEIIDTLIAPRGSFLDTKVHATNTTRVVATFDVQGVGEYWFGAWDGAWNDRAYALCNDGNGVYVGYGTVGGTLVKPVIAKGVHEIELRGIDDNGWKAQFYLDGTLKCTTPTTDQTMNLDSTLYLFAQNRLGVMAQQTAQGSLYFKGGQIYEGEELIRDFVPARRLTDGVVGVLDRANGYRFYESSGDVAFTADGTYEPQTGGGEIKVGEVQFVVDAGKTLVNGTLPIEGFAKVVKKGAGTYVNKISHSYWGGTIVEDGVYQAFNDGTGNYAFDKFHHLGVSGSAVEVAKDATFDICGNHGLCEHPIVLAGGTLATTGYDHGNAADSTGLGKLTLTADSFIDAEATFLLRGNTDQMTTDLDGYTLTCTIAANKSLLERGYGFANGSFKVVGAGSLVSTWLPVDMSGATLEIGGDVGLSLFSDITAGTLRITTSATTYYAGSKDSRISILDRYVPVADGVFAYRFADGVVLDFSKRDAVLDATGKTFEFASDARTAFVDMGDRTAMSSKPLITWDAKPENVEFRGVPGTVGRFEAKEDGLYRRFGFVVIFQ